MNAAPIGLSGSPPLHQSGNYDLYLVRGDQSPELMQTLGRARSEGFAASGQGAGSDVDLSPEDEHYHHLILWHREQNCLAGAYRLGLIEEIISEHGPGGLYLDGVFKIDPCFYERVSPALELSRSFILPRFQRDSQGLGLLWKGLGSAANQFKIKNLYGSVTMPNTFSSQSRSAAVNFFKTHLPDDPELKALVQARRPFVPSEFPPFDGQDKPRIDHLAKAIAKFEGGKRSIPPLMKYYTFLGARFLDFHVEAAFGNALYCLLRVDLSQIPAGYRRRFL